ncbi:MAG: Hint domain [Roseibaca calidilacus]|uniref:Hint domain n=1 Tax=Roseibaca calidilacus TaxID=1666912 RepID=A0A0P7YXU1_9RHOB|nr:Hint domain-containing protein [Roseibaca calidilacus]KPP95770.1 MAG: Hint domain [Roseibaca calidilacus]CUX81736.1 Hint domain-containing protein [Roseibaca calidilacus]
MTHYDCEIFDAAALRGLWGINEGEPLGPAESLYLGDMYQLCPGAQARTISVEIAQDAYRTSEGSVTVLAELRWMAQDNDVVDSVLLDVQGALSLLPLSPLRHDAHYTLIGIEPGQTRLRLSQLVYGCFCAGTRIMSGDGHLTPIEALSAGDYVLTRDNGAQPLLWVGKTTVRAVGLFAPVCLPAGYMGNLGPLVVAPLQRIFLYQRGGLTANGRSEALIQARHLVDGNRVNQREGGFVTYHALVFEDHQIIYAEGIPVESLLVSRATVARLPEAFARDLSERYPHLNHRAHFAQTIDMAALTKAKCSSGT